MQNIFLHDKGNNIKNLSSNISSTDTTTIIAEVGIVEKKDVTFEWTNNFNKKRYR